MNINQAPIGTKIWFGTFDGDEDMLWYKVGSNNVFIGTSIPRSFVFDAEEPENTSRARRKYGNNLYPQSNIHQWLNSSGDSWFRQSHKYDEAEFRMCTQKGFLSNFNELEFKAMADHKVTIATPLGSKKEFGNRIDIEAKVWLPSISELLPDKVELDEEGESLQAEIALRNSAGWQTLMTRTGCKDGGHIYTYSQGIVRQNMCNDFISVFPLIELKGDLGLSPNPDEHGVYSIPSCSICASSELIKFMFCD